MRVQFLDLTSAPPEDSSPLPWPPASLSTQATNMPPAALSLYRQTWLGAALFPLACTCSSMLLTMVQLPSVSSSSRPSLHRAFSFLSQYSDESSTLLLHSTCSTQINPSQVEQHWIRTTQNPGAFSNTHTPTQTHTIWVTHSLSSASLCVFSSGR